MKSSEPATVNVSSSDGESSSIANPTSYDVAPTRGVNLMVAKNLLKVPAGVLPFAMTLVGVGTSSFTVIGLDAEWYEVVPDRRSTVRVSVPSEQPIGANFSGPAVDGRPEIEFSFELTAAAPAHLPNFNTPALVPELEVDAANLKSLSVGRYFADTEIELAVPRSTSVRLAADNVITGIRIGGALTAVPHVPDVPL